MKPFVFRIGAAVLLGALATIFFIIPRIDKKPDAAPLMTERKMPKALAGHMKRLEAIPGNLGESEEGPGTASAEKFLALAYPDTDIPLERLEGARAAAGRLKGKNFPTGKVGESGTGGPSQALLSLTESATTPGYVRTGTWRAGADRAGH